ncbi:hypothetical protein HUT06_21545 [Actinomadura sp. NAK00032]|uniref:hypothetical protein n=1 Tax=Actinomadura sp. NAK00032 TaxID=2742128 RepID=UPI0015923BA1|nr:hypothetical protein [Actinomadura sp. NAK00032]QKW36296.1 hypothetical protein HUT06_21545 [Actinomadura sp. NAK00032]
MDRWLGARAEGFWPPGRHDCPLSNSYEVVGSTRSPAKTGMLHALGAEPVVVDAVADAVAKAEPEVIVHQLTALGGETSMRNVRRMAAATNRLRTEGTDHLLSAARAVGVRTFVAQSNAMWMERTGGPVADENGRIEPHPPEDAAPSVAALRHLEDAVTGITWADGIVLRYGAFYRGRGHRWSRLPRRPYGPPARPRRR